jgi:hypothetical protein
LQRRQKGVRASRVKYGYAGFLGGNTNYTNFRWVRKTHCPCATPSWVATNTYDHTINHDTMEVVVVSSTPDTRRCLCGASMVWWHKVALTDDYFLYEARDEDGVTLYSEEGTLTGLQPYEVDWGLAELLAWDFSTQAWNTAYEIGSGTPVGIGTAVSLAGWTSWANTSGCPAETGGDGWGGVKNVFWSSALVHLPADGQYAGDFQYADAFLAALNVRNWFRARIALDTGAGAFCVSEMASGSDWTLGACATYGTSGVVPAGSLAGEGTWQVRARDSKANLGQPMPACCDGL